MKRSYPLYFLISLFGILLISGLSSAFAQDSLATLLADSSTITVRTVDADRLESITEDDAFIYTKAQDPETLWSRIQRWIIQTIFTAFENKWVRFFFKIAFFAIFALVLVGLINQLLGGNIKSAFSAKKGSQGLSLKTAIKDIEKLDLNELLNNALAENRYSDAVRILYLKSLNELNELGLIEWKPDKTNHDYLDELDHHPSRNFFSRLTYYYEYVEYGDFQIEEKGYKNVENVYRKFRKEARGSA